VFLLHDRSDRHISRWLSSPRRSIIIIPTTRHSKLLPVVTGNLTSPHPSVFLLPMWLQCVAPSRAAFIRKARLSALINWHARYEPEQTGDSTQFSWWPNLSLDPVQAAHISLRLPPQYYMHISRLVTGHTYTNEFTACFRPPPGGIPTTPACPCGHHTQSAHHIFFVCPLAQSFRWLLPAVDKNHPRRMALLVQTPNRCIRTAQFIRASLAFTRDYPRAGDPPTPEAVGRDYSVPL
jgi:hypothetical protein